VQFALVKLKEADNRKHEKAARRTHNMNPLGLSVGNL